MKIGIHGKIFSEEIKPTIQLVFSELSKRSSTPLVSRAFHEILKGHGADFGAYEIYENHLRPREVDAMFTLGGDGTLLEAVTHIGASEIPILGINTGRLGFLATTAKEDIPKAIEAIFDGAYAFDFRTLLHLDSDQGLFNGANFALNDFTILKKDSSSMIVVHTYLNGMFLNSYWADGIIVSTPTGSTGYNLSCGGPLVLPQSNNFIITPVSPHSLTLRPMVVSDNSEISFQIEDRNKHFLVTLDSRHETVDANVKISVKKESFEAKLIKLDNHNIFETMKQKLKWGMDARN